MIGKRLRQAREKKGLTLRAVAEAMGVTPQAVSQWERSNPSFSVSKVAAIASLLGVDWKWLDGENGDDHNQHIHNKEPTQDLYHNKIPILNRFQAYRFYLQVIGSRPYTEKYVENFLQDEKVKFIHSSNHIGIGGFAFIMDNETLEPSIIKGDILIFSTNIESRSGDIVLASMHEGISSLKMIVDFYDNLIEEYEITHNLLHSAKSTPLREKDVHNEDMPDEWMHNDGVSGVIFAVAVEHRKFRRIKDA